MRKLQQAWTRVQLAWIGVRLFVSDLTIVFREGPAEDRARIHQYRLVERRHTLRRRLA
jgi:hypothetical protein